MKKMVMAVVAMVIFLGFSFTPALAFEERNYQITVVPKLPGVLGVELGKGISNSGEFIGVGWEQQGQEWVPVKGNIFGMEVIELDYEKYSFYSAVGITHAGISVLNVRTVGSDYNFFPLILMGNDIIPLDSLRTTLAIDIIDGKRGSGEFFILLQHGLQFLVAKVGKDGVVIGYFPVTNLSTDDYLPSRISFDGDKTVYVAGGTVRGNEAFLVKINIQTSEVLIRNLGKGYLIRGVNSRGEVLGKITERIENSWDVREVVVVWTIGQYEQIVKREIFSNSSPYRGIAPSLIGDEEIFVEDYWPSKIYAVGGGGGFTKVCHDENISYFLAGSSGSGSLVAEGVIKKDVFSSEDGIFILTPETYPITIARGSIYDGTRAEGYDQYSIDFNIGQIDINGLSGEEVFKIRTGGDEFKTKLSSFSNRGGKFLYYSFRGTSVHIYPNGKMKISRSGRSGTYFEIINGNIEVDVFIGGKWFSSGGEMWEVNSNPAWMKYYYPVR